MIFALSVLMVWQIARLIGSSRQPNATLSQPSRKVMNAFPAVQIPLSPGSEAISVTEHTTRTFDPGRIKRPADDDE
jgi:hypothetical protein